MAAASSKNKTKYILKIGCIESICDSAEYYHSSFSNILISISEVIDTLLISPTSRTQVINERSRGMEQRQFSCIKCSGTECTEGEIRTTGSGVSRFFNLQNQKFASVSCSNCGYTEFYRRSTGRAGNIFDIVAGG